MPRLPGRGFPSHALIRNPLRYAAKSVTGVTPNLALKANPGTITGASTSTVTGVTAALTLAAPTGTASGPGVLPNAILDMHVDLQNVVTAATWTPVTTYVYAERQKPAISRGRAPESATPVPQTFTAQFNNRDSRFSPHNPAGPYWNAPGTATGLNRNTPLRVHVPAATGRLRMEDDTTSYASTPSSAALNVAGDLELRIDVKPVNWTASVLASKWSAAAGNFSWAWLLNGDGTLSFWFSTDGSTVVKTTSTQPLPWPGGRISLKVTYAQASGNTAFYYATSIGGSYTQIGATVTASASGVLFASNAAVAVGASTYFAGLAGYLGGITATNAWAPAAYQGLTGGVYEFQVRSGIGGSLVADPMFGSATDGATSLSDVQGNTWTCAGTAAVSWRAYRFHGEVSEWPVLWDESGADVYTTVTASGLLRRIQQKNAPVSSALTRYWTKLTGTFAPVAYWPCEDGNNSQVVTLGLVTTSKGTPTSIVSGLTGGLPMVTSSGHTTQFASGDVSNLVCTNPLPVPNTDSWKGDVPAYTGTGTNVIRFLLTVPTGGETSACELVRFYTQGTPYLMDVQYQTGGKLEVLGFDNHDNQLFDTNPIAVGIDGTTCIVELVTTQSGPNVNYSFNVLKLGASAVTVGSSGSVPGTVGNVWRVTVNPKGPTLPITMQSSIGHIAVQTATSAMDTITAAGGLTGPFNAWQGETAALRVARLCAEQGYATQITGYPQTSVIMGGQAAQTFMNLLQECEAADHGVIYEPRGALAIAYRTSGSLCAQASSVAGALPLALSYTSAHLGGGGHMPMTPTDDDQLTLNDELATRGSSSVTGALFEVTATAAQYSANAGLSTAASPAGVGVYQDSQTINVNTDNQLPDQGGWLVHMGTVNEPRYSAIPVDLARTELASFYYTIPDLDIGDYLQVTSPPAWLGADTIKALIWGYQEQMGGYIWTVNWATRPESPWEVLIAGTGALADSRADADGATVHAGGWTSGATSVQVDTSTGNAVWTTVAGDFPFDIIVSGERITVTNITGAASPQTFTVTRAVNGVVKAQTAGTTVNLFQPCYAALA